MEILPSQPNCVNLNLGEMYMYIDSLSFAFLPLMPRGLQYNTTYPIPTAEDNLLTSHKSDYFWKSRWMQDCQACQRWFYVSLLLLNATYLKEQFLPAAAQKKLSKKAT